ncbi:hypothetical protein V1512DRAFT_209927 [Lipomyces arxii]|uniref:uncharacterized protein n=1 Tax=Lipomyces arxii TaxID=56418 RepID=UPI0034CFE367
MSKLHQTQQIFYNSFQSSKSSLELLLATDPLPTPSNDLLDAITVKLDQLVKEVQNAKVYLAPYDQRAYSSQLDALIKAFEELKERTRPKSRFTFASRVRVQPTSTESVPSSPTSVVDLSSSVELPGVSVNQIKRQTGRFIAVSELSPFSTAVISGIENSIVYFPPNVKLTNVQIKDCTTSILILPCQIDGPVHLSRVNSCVVLLRQIHQFRMHESVDSDIFFGRTGGRIIERCDDLLFSSIEFDKAYEHISIKPFVDTIDDFDHPAGPSPNWSTIDEDTTTKFTDKQYEEIVRLSKNADSPTVLDRTAKIIRAALSREMIFEGEADTA